MKYPIPISNFINLPFNYQLGVFLEWLDSEDISIASTTICWAVYARPRINKESTLCKLLKLHKPKENKHDVLVIDGYCESDNVVESYSIALIKLLNKLQNPF